jgi:UDP-N-acetyl-D-glucosamine dehydrogenase
MLREKLKTRQANIGVIGLGYVGLPLAVEFAREGFNVVGIDHDSKKVNAINSGKSYITDIKSSAVRDLLKRRKLRATTNFNVISSLDSLSICVPTPLTKTKDPDISFIISATRAIKKYIRKEQLIILESTSYPGTTEEIIKPILEEGGLRAGKDFYLAFSPERIDPGNKSYNTKNIPKVVGGVTKKCTGLASLLYGQIIDTVIPVSSTQVAEMVKLLENTFRSVNIALVNETAQMCERLGIDVWEVIETAKTKPFGYMAFYPGPGLGGHCIPVDPLYLSWVAKKIGFESRFINLADQINSSMPRFVVGKTTDALNKHKKSIKGSRIHIFGIAYKKDVTDSRESPAFGIISVLKSKGATVSYTDPYIKDIKFDDISLKSRNPSNNFLDKIDCSIIVTDHSIFDYDAIVKKSKLIVDTRNALKGFKGKNICRL